MSDPTDIYFLTENSWLGLSNNDLIALDQQLVQNALAALTQCDIAVTGYNQALIQRNDDTTQSWSAMSIYYRKEMLRARLRRELLNSQFEALIASGYKTDPNSPVTFTRWDFV